MARGGYRPNSGPIKGTKYKKRLPKIDIVSAAESEGLSPLEYMLRIMNDPKEDIEIRARMAVAAAPYVHPKAGESGKKNEKEERAKIAGIGKFSPSKPPLKLIK